jgi:Na+/H+ antiporter NhaD/arsenite permease-like protein
VLHGHVLVYVYICVLAAERWGSGALLIDSLPNFMTLDRFERGFVQGVCGG